MMSVRAMSVMSGERSAAAILRRWTCQPHPPRAPSSWRAALVRMNTVSRESNLELIHFIRDELARHGVASRLTFDDERAQGEPVRHRRRGQAGRRDRLRPHRHRAVGRPGLVVRSARRRAARRPPLRPRQRRHEGLHRPGRGAGAGVPRGRSAVRRAPRLQLRRGGRLLRRAAARSPTCATRGIAPLACIVGEPTGMVPALAHKGVYRWRCCVTRPCGAFVADAAVGQRDRGRRARRSASSPTWRERWRDARAALRGLRRAVQHRLGRA